MAATVYIETTIPSAYVTSRTDAASVHRREATREWWQIQHPLYDACIHNMDFLLTWNIRHLANPNKYDHLTVINRRLGLLTPRIVTPEMLWLEDLP